MGRRFHQSEREEETKVDISPLIDCVFILLIFFIVTTTFVDEKGKTIPTPDSASTPPPPSDEEPSNVIIQVTERGEVMSDGVAVGVGGVQTLIQNSRDGRESPVLIQAVGDARVGLLMRVKEEVERAGSETVSVSARHGGN